MSGQEEPEEPRVIAIDYWHNLHVAQKRRDMEFYKAIVLAFEEPPEPPKPPTRRERIAYWWNALWE